MANLNGQNIGTNYKGIINIGSTINQNISASLQLLTDGDGNNLPIQVSTTQAIIGGGSSTGRLVVRGDGTNPVLRGENGAGSTVLTVNNAGNLDALSFSIAGGSTITYAGGPATTVFGGGRYFRFDGNLSGGSVLTLQNGTNGLVSVTSGTNNITFSFANFAPAAGSSILRLYNAQYTINASGTQTGNITGYFLNATETNLNGITHNLMDLQVGGVSRFRVSGNGRVNMAALPTSSAGLSAGDLWNNGGVLNIV